MRKQNARLDDEVRNWIINLKAEPKITNAEDDFQELPLDRDMWFWYF